MSHPTIEISYWPIGGRTAAARLALAYDGIPVDFEPNTDWEKAKEDRVTFPTQDIPVFRVNGGRSICESSALTYYAGMLTGLWPKDPLQAAMQLEVIATWEEVLTSPFGTCYYKTFPMFNKGTN